MPLGTARTTWNSSLHSMSAYPRKAQQPLNDAQTPAQPLGCPVGVPPPLVQRPDDNSNRRVTHWATNIGYTPTLMCPQGAVHTLLINVPAQT
ncbi:hypothetical protein GPALN_006560 [Globodera pallida]|nr:hypothetical protein GPALN_006553 [Globodera pallida]KAI3410202.1 hypothetical protein GPALN_006560 [Globodera pallida]